MEEFGYLSHLKRDLQEKAGELGAKCDDCQEKSEEILRRFVLKYYES